MAIVEREAGGERVILTGREMDVMEVLWRLGSGTVAEVRKGLQARLAYTTVLTVLRTLEKKGYAGHEAEGRAHRFLPLVEREEAQESALRRVTRKLFSGSPELVMAQLLSERGLSEDELRRLRDLVDDRLRSEERAQGTEEGSDRGKRGSNAFRTRKGGER